MSMTHTVPEAALRAGDHVHHDAPLKRPGCGHEACNYSGFTHLARPQMRMHSPVDERWLRTHDRKERAGVRRLGHDT